MIEVNCGPCGNVLCSQYGCIKQAQRQAAQQFRPVQSQYPSVNEHLSALNKIVELAGENAVLKHENEKLKLRNEELYQKVMRLELNTQAFKDGNKY